MTKTAKLTVFFDGSCPLCVREIGFYRRRTALSPIDWVDVSTADPEGRDIPLSQCDAMKRFHVMREDGALLSGAAAFAELWKRYPGFRLIGRIVAVPAICHVAELGYRFFLTLRPAVQSLTRKIINGP